MSTLHYLRRLLLFVSALGSVAILIQSLLSLQPQHTYKKSNLQAQQPETHNNDKESFRPIDAAFVDSKFDHLKAIIRTQKRLTRYWSQVDQMMKHRRPVMHSNSLRLHSPSGRNYSNADLLKLGNDGLAVPNVAHFVLPFGNSELKFHHRVCLLSCVWLMRPRLLFLWYEKPPTGQHWEAVQRNLSESGLWESTVVFARRDVPSAIYGLPVHKMEHKSDLMRLEAVLQFGGAYFDLDVITLRPLTSLRRFNFTIGRQSVDGLCNGVFLAAPNSSFLVLWHLAYQVFDQFKWSALSVNLPHHMCASEAFRHLCHVEEDSMDQPTWNRMDLIYKRPRKWPWQRRNYVMHLWYRFHPVQYNMSSIRSVDSMLGDMFRFVLFGNDSVIR
ncbi:hypothetical protein BOX15_Mlig028034g1 [Macrostomum lignano]|uniref:Alpha-1,4-N-acetylglucosaminyltransferase n=1 Tax=Macrostomum lignano TaxID=282301 RepID=A0A267GZV2_9PLAT|nr:hypothetical protein BOX15_Mlig028034g1 [Macrostomum lignano]